MARMRTMFVLMLVLALMPGALAQGLAADLSAMIPANAVLEKTEEIAGMRLYTLSILETGEVMLLAGTADGTMLQLETTQAAQSDPGAAPVERSFAEELVRRDYPDCRILFARDVEAGKELGVAADGFCGTVTAADGRICSRSLAAGEIYRSGRLTMDGALKVLELHRPDAEFYALELDEDDGVYVYEGEALVQGVAYEFEMHASTGRMLEWERD